MGSLEFAILDFIQENMKSPLGDRLMVFVSGLGDAGIIWIALAAVLLCFKKTRHLGAAAAAGLIIDVVCCNMILKPLVARVRPFDVNTAVQLIIDAPHDFSFPSGHTAASFTAASALFFSRSRLWIPSAVLAVLIGFSRMYLYVHYPSDVLAGAVLGVLFGLAGSVIQKKLAAKYR